MKKRSLRWVLKKLKSTHTRWLCMLSDWKCKKTVQQLEVAFYRTDIMILRFVKFTGSGDVFIWVKNSRMGRWTPNKQTNKRFVKVVITVCFSKIISSSLYILPGACSNTFIHSRKPTLNNDRSMCFLSTCGAGFNHRFWSGKTLVKIHPLPVLNPTPFAAF